MGAMQLEKVEISARGHPRGGDELVTHEVHVGPGHLAGNLADWQVGKR